MIRFMPHLVASVSLLVGPIGHAAVVYDESVAGDLSSDGLNPTVISLDNGSNQLIGSVIAAPGDRDFFTITIGTNQTLEAIILENFDSTENQSFFAVQAGPQVTSITDASVLLGNSLIGAAAGRQQGDDVLDDLDAAPFGGTGFTGPLGAGTYTFWFQETAAAVDYAFDLQVVPIPAAVWLFASALFSLGWLRSRAV